MKRTPRTYRVLTYSSLSGKKLTKRVEKALAELDAAGWRIETVSFGVNSWLSSQAYITVSWSPDDHPDMTELPKFLK